MSEKRIWKYRKTGRFQSEGTYPVAVVAVGHLNVPDSIRLAREYLATASEILDSPEARELRFSKEVGELHSIIAKISNACDLLLDLHFQREKFRNHKTSGPSEWATKQAVRLYARWTFVAHYDHMSYRLMHLHGRVSEILNSRERED